MGEIVSKLIGNPDEKNQEEMDKVEAMLDVMTDLVKSKIDAWNKNIIISSEGEKKVPVCNIICWDQTIRASVQNQVAPIGEEIKKIAGQFVAGNYVDGIADSITTVLSTVMGSCAGTTSERESYIVTVGNAGALLRIDYYVYYREVKASRMLREKVKNMMGVAYSVSSVDPHKISPATVRSVIELSLPGDTLPAEKIKLQAWVYDLLEMGEQMEKMAKEKHSELLKGIAQEENQGDGRLKLRSGPSQNDKVKLLTDFFSNSYEKNFKHMELEEFKSNAFMVKLMEKERDLEAKANDRIEKLKMYHGLEDHVNLRAEIRRAKKRAHQRAVDDFIKSLDSEKQDELQKRIAQAEDQAEREINDEFDNDIEETESTGGDNGKPQASDQSRTFQDKKRDLTPASNNQASAVKV